MLYSRCLGLRVAVPVRVVLNIALVHARHLGIVVLKTHGEYGYARDWTQYVLRVPRREPDRCSGCRWGFLFRKVVESTGR